jgi:hypothetical protein
VLDAVMVAVLDVADPSTAAGLKVTVTPVGRFSAVRLTVPV